MTDPIIYHGTPMTPRAALNDVLAGRAACVSFYRPDDVEAVEAVSPQILFRQRAVQQLAGRASSRTGMERGGSRPDALLRVARTASLRAWAGGGHSRRPGRAEPAQRRSDCRLALRSEGCTALAYEPAGREAGPALREVGPGLRGLGRRIRPIDRGHPSGGAGGGLRRLPSEDGRGRCADGQRLASAAHDARDPRCSRVPLLQRGQQQPGTEWVAL